MAHFARRFIVTMTMLGLASAASRTVEAGPLTVGSPNHAFAGPNGDYYQGHGQLSASYSFYDESPDPSHWSHGHLLEEAVAELRSDGTLRLGAYAEKTGGNWFGGAVSGLAGWRDTLYLSSSSPLDAPAQLLLTFAVNGHIGAINGQASLGVGLETYSHTGNSQYGGRAVSDGITASVSGSSGDVPSVLWDGNRVSILGDVVWDDPMLPSGMGGFHIIAYLNAWVSGSATADAMHTLTLASVTLADGGALPEGVSYSFQSGMVPTSVAVVPEPSTLTMSAIAVLLGLGYARRRRTKSMSSQVSGRPASQGTVFPAGWHW